MKTIKILAVIFFISGITVFAQNLWKTEVALNFTVQSNTKVSSFVDENGIHIVYFRNGGIRYALANSQGGVIKYDKVIESEGSGTDFANVVANGNMVYAIYHKNNYIRVARSTNLGDSWNTSFSSRPLSNTDCNKIVAYRDGSNIKITWSERRVGSSNNDVHFINFSPSPNPAWSEYRRVSENESSGGDNPDFAFTSEKVEVNYTSFYQPKNRERLSNGNWNNSEFIPYVQGGPSNIIKTIKPHIIGNTLNVIYNNDWGGMTASGVHIGHSYRNLNNTQWTDNQSILTTDYYNFEPYPHVSANTADGKIHLIYWEYGSLFQRWSYRQLNGTTFSNHIAEIPLAILSASLNAVSNDLFLVRTDNPSTPGNIKLRHYDAAPLAPQNPQLSTNPSNNRVRVSWSKNQEPDISIYEVWRKVAEMGGNWQLIGTTTNNYFVDNEYYYAPKAGDFTLTYRVRAKDIGNNFSLYSNEVTVRAEYLGKENLAGNNTEYKLIQNYPNPFNPSTKISYSIKEDGFVTLKVYDILGVEIATLVNEQKTAGTYEADFNAANLPSGMYVYKLQSGSFTDVKKMLLTK
jgi:hypothetical protein